MNLPSKKIKLLCVDLDGTLIQFHNQLHQHSVDALNRFLTINDAEVIIFTGRALYSTVFVLDQLQEQLVKPIRYVVCFNGAMIYDVEKNEVLHETFIEGKIAKEIFDFCKQKKIVFWGYPKLLPNKKTYVILNKNFSTWLISLAKRKHLMFVDEIAEDCDFQKIIVTNYKSVDKEFKYLKEKYNGQLEICFSHNKAIEITFHGTTKGVGVDFFKEKLNLSPDEIASIGNSFNDLPMFIKAKYNIAMYHSPDELKKYAQLVTNKSRKTGFGDAIDHIIEYKKD